MSRLTKIKMLHLEKRKDYRVILAVELFAFLIGIAGLFGKNAVYEYGVDEISCYFENAALEQDAVVIEHGEANVFDISGIDLPRGTYRIQLHYVTDTDALNRCTVEDSGLAQGLLRTNGAGLYSGLDCTDYEIWLLRNSKNLMVHVNYAGEGMLAVQGVTIHQTNAMNRIILFYIIVFSLALNVVYCYVLYDRTYKIPVKDKTVIFTLGLIILVASIPVSVDYMLPGGDLAFHLMRVEGIKDGILSGQFPIRISPEWQQGYGYAAPIFYGETFLYAAVLFRLIGFTVTTSYRMFMFVITIATVLTAYHSFKNMFKEAYIGVFCSMLYTLSIYRINKTYYIGAWGECFGVMLLPLICYAFYRIFSQDIHDKSYGRSWLPLAAGMALLLQSHLLTCEIVGGFAVLLCIILWRKVFRKETFLVLVKAVIGCLLFSAWFFIPFLDYMFTGDFVIHNVSARTIQFRGLLPAHLFLIYFKNGKSPLIDTGGMVDTQAVGLGIAPVAVLFILAFLFITGSSKKLGSEYRKLAMIASAFSVLAMLMSLSLFPWDRIQNINDLIGTLVSSIQFPNRFLTVANVGLTVVAGIVMKYLMRDGRAVKIYICGTILLLTVSSLHLQEEALDRDFPIRVYNSAGMGTGYISGGEYLPYGAKASLFMYHDPVCTGVLRVDDYNKLSLGAKARMVNPGDKTESASFGLLYYKGYHAYDESDREMICYPGYNYEVTVDIPPGFDGNVRVRFVSPWYWRAGEAVTLLTIVFMTVFYWKKAGARRWQLQER